MGRRELIEAAALSIVAQLLGIASFVCIASSLQLDLGLFAIGWSRSVMILVSMIPLSIAGLGLREGASLLTLPALGVSPETAVAFALLVTAVTVIGPAMIGGALEVARLLMASERQDTKQ